MNKAYACYNKSEEIRQNSSSGGLFYLLATKVISNGGVVFGAAFNDSFEVFHRKVDRLEDIDSIMRSKYVQSDIGSAYKEIKTLVDSGKLVLFSGTPCQVSGVKAICGNSDKLITIDFICHGTPLRKTWYKYLRAISNGRNIRTINFRDKTYGWTNYSLRIDFEDGVYIKNKLEDPYLRAFSMNLSLRDSCYSCAYRGIDRQADITLADYWGVKTVHPNMHKQNGTSAVIIRTRIGEKLFEEISDDIELVESDIDILSKYNSSLVKSPAINPKRDAFLNELDNASEHKQVLEIFKKYTHISLFSRICSKAKNVLKNVYRRISRLLRR